MEIVFTEQQSHVLRQCGRELAFVAAAILVATHFAPGSAFAATLPSNYAACVLPVLVAGLVIQFIEYANVMFEDDVTNISKCLIVVALSLVGIAGALTWTANFPEGRVDWLAVMAILFAFLATVVSLKESRPGEWRPSWTLALCCVDIPLLVGLLATFLFKLLCYDYFDHAFGNQWITLFPIPPGSPPKWDEQNRALLETMRSNFWIGFSTGIVAVQLITAQVVSMALRCYEAFIGSTRVKVR